MNGSVTSAGEIAMNRRSKNAPIDIHHEVTVTKEFSEYPIETRVLPNIPQRLGVVQGDDTVELRWAAIPGRAVRKVGANERRNLTYGITGHAPGNYISDHHVALGIELPPVSVRDPMMGREPQSFQ
jgi:hypothetical protein